jgi:hypothetical protein
MVTTYGWGTMENGQLSDVCRSAQMPIFGFRPSWNPVVTDLAWSNDGQSSPAKGDSGTPFLVKRDGEWLAIGPYSQGEAPFKAACNSLFAPAFYSWVTSHTRDLPAQRLLPSALIMRVLG